MKHFLKFHFQVQKELAWSQMLCFNFPWPKWKANTAHNIFFMLVYSLMCLCVKGRSDARLTEDPFFY